MERDIQYHRERAIDELDRAFDAASQAAAEAHFWLSSLHIERAEQLCRTWPSRSRLALV